MTSAITQNALPQRSPYIYPAQYFPQNYSQPITGTSKWKTGICDFSDDCANSAEIFLCHWCHLSRQFNMISHNKPEINYSYCCVVCIADIFIFPGLGTLTSNLKIRGILQQKYNIDNLNFFDDIVYAILLPPCVVCQHYREMTLHNQCPGNMCKIQNAPKLYPII
jgi:Cys-rich protein (TIGR01571 family)